MTRKRYVGIAYGFAVCVLISPFAVLQIERCRVASASNRSQVQQLLGVPDQTFRDSNVLKSKFRDWDFHELNSGAVVTGKALPDVKDRTCIFRGTLGPFTEFLVYFEDGRVVASYFLGFN